MANPYFLPPLENGEYPVKFTEEDYVALESERDKRLKPNSEILMRIERIERNLEKVLDVIAQLEAMIAKIAPSLDQLSENPAKFLMSVIGGGKNVR